MVRSVVRGRGGGWVTWAVRASAAALVAGWMPAAVGAQSADAYMDYEALTSAVDELADEGDELARVSSLARSEGGRDVWLLTLGSESGRALDQRPALLVVGNLEANRVAGSHAVLRVAERLLDAYGSDDAVTNMLDTRTVYLIPRANPDGAELVFTLPSHETAYKPYQGNTARGGLNAREFGRDLDGDGLVTRMRVRSPEGELVEREEDPRLLREAMPAREEGGVYEVMAEGIHPDSLDAYVPLGGDGVNLNLNFQHEYQYFEPHVGPHMVSEVESRALVDFVFEHPNIAAVLTFSAFDNLRSPTPEDRQPPPAVTGNPPRVPTNLTADDRPYFEYVSERFRELTGLSGEGAPNEGGSFPQFAYYQMGLPSFTTPVWSPPAGSEPVDARWLALFDSVGVDGYVDWRPATHPQLGEVEVGGFAPNARVNPPASELDGLLDRHAEFALWLGNRLPEVEVVDVEVEARGQGVWRITATLANEAYFPTQLDLAERIRFNRPINVRLVPNDDLDLLSDDMQHQIPRIEGMGGRAEFSWLVTGEPGVSAAIEVFAERAGGSITVPVTLGGGEDR
ncbi:MAG: M14 family metallopeptidase [Gemmatimonadota bacterium]|nr:M14 family metallopeptidase [Gemmatimonadota bacterium]